MNVDDNFEPLYVVSPDKKSTVTELKSLLKDVDELYLATDGDREGEAIAWHLLETLKPRIPVKRMVFHEITEPAIRAAADNPRDLDNDLVDAQETRRILDRLYGYEVSPVLWKKVMPKLSAGRVQSVATRIIVDRERERMAFTSADYWDIAATLDAGEDATPQTFSARLVGVDDARVATGRDFDSTGRLKKTDGVVVSTRPAPGPGRGPAGAAALTVASVEEKPYTRKPYAPFMTSTLQQEAGRKLRFHLRPHHADRAASVRERLRITYMRTDSTTLSESAISAARAQAADLYGAQYVHATPRQYTRKVKNAQEAHEAIRPAGETFRTPGQVAAQLDTDEFRLYELIWQRTVSSQMADAKGTTMSLRISGTAASGETATFAASGRTITFPGFLLAYVETVDEQTGGQADDAESRLPNLVQRQGLTAADLTADGHSTNPPARFTEASLVKVLEELGIAARPHTPRSSAPSRTVAMWSRRAVRWSCHGWRSPWSGCSKAISTASLTTTSPPRWRTISTRSPLATRTAPTGSPSSISAVTPPNPTSRGPAASRNSSVSTSRRSTPARSTPSNCSTTTRAARCSCGSAGSPYLERNVAGPDARRSCSGQPARRDDPDELTIEVAEKLFATPQEGVLGVDPLSGHQIVAKEGRFGPYVTEILPADDDDDGDKGEGGEPLTIPAGPTPRDGGTGADVVPLDAPAGTGATTTVTKTVRRTAKKVAKKAGPKPRTGSLFKTMDIATVTLDDALKLLSLPRPSASTRPRVRRSPRRTAATARI